MEEIVDKAQQTITTSFQIVKTKTELLSQKEALEANLAEINRLLAKFK